MYNIYLTVADVEIVFTLEGVLGREFCYHYLCLQKLPIIEEHFSGQGHS